MRIAGSKGDKNAPKFDTKNKSASDYHAKNTTSVSVNALANGSKLSSLSAGAQRDVEAIIQHSWDSLALLAQRYWDNESPPVEEAEAEPEFLTCGKFGKGFAKPAVIPNTYMVPCPKCHSQQYVG